MGESYAWGEVTTLVLNPSEPLKTAEAVTTNGLALA